jgi:hypothetical protein
MLGIWCFAFCGCQRSALPVASAPSSAPEWFADITASSGVQFVHLAGTNYFLPDEIGSGIALLDFDNDGRLDLYFVQNGGTNSSARNQLFHQQPEGSFRNVSAGSGVDVAAGRGMGAFAADVNKMA